MIRFLFVCLSLAFANSLLFADETKEPNIVVTEVHRAHPVAKVVTAPVRVVEQFAAAVHANREAVRTERQASRASCAECTSGTCPTCTKTVTKTVTVSTPVVPTVAATVCAPQSNVACIRSRCGVRLFGLRCR